MQLSSTSLHEGGTIPKQYTGDGADHSPHLHWINPPAEAKSFVLICDDPDAPHGTWVHWVLFNLPPDRHELPENVPPHGTLPTGAKQGKNDFNKLGYGGPAPPKGDKPHRYFFKVFALDTTLELPEGTTKLAVEHAMKGHILAHAEMIGKYGR
jgi:Raf kinase inhibitor-like YbhB/YbcL family protein